MLVTRPTRAHYFLLDQLVALGLAYGPAARERIAEAYPELFGHSGSTLRGYERWLVRSGARDTTESFASFMDERYRRWLGNAAA